MDLLDCWKVKILRGAIRIAIRRPMPERLTLGDRRNNNYQVRIGDQDDDYRIHPRAVRPDGIEGWCFANNKERTDVSLPNAQLIKFPINFVHHYREFRIDTNSLALFIAQRLIGYPFFTAWKHRFGQFIFNRKRLVRQDRIAILRYIFEKTVENTEFKTSITDLPAKNIWNAHIWSPRS